MGIGAYRHLVTLVQPAGVADPVRWYCQIQSAATQVIDGQAAFFIRGRYHPGITLETQIHFAGRAFQVQSVTDIDERQIELALMCVEVVGRHGHSVAVLRTYQQQVVADGASQYWPLDDAIGTTARNLVMANHGTISGGITLNQPGLGTSKCMTFNGTTGQIATAAVVAMPITMTIEAWIKTSASVGYRTMIATPGASGLFYGTTAGALTIFIAGGGGVEVRNVADGQWHQVAAVLTSASCQHFIDGVLVTTDLTPHPGVSDGLATMGRDAAGNFWSGQLQDVAIYPRALTPTEIAAHYTLGVAR